MPSISNLLWLGLFGGILSSSEAFLTSKCSWLDQAHTGRRLCPIYENGQLAFVARGSFRGFDRFHVKNANSLNLAMSAVQKAEKKATTSAQNAQNTLAKPLSKALLKETVQTLFELVDMDGNGLIDLEEFRNLAGIVCSFSGW